MIKWIKKLTRRDAHRGQTMTLRRWQAAQTDRLNESQWSSVTGSTINFDIQANLETLRTRSTYEAANNPIVEGMINTYCDDVVGAAGPTLQVESSNKAYNQELERIWQRFWAMPDINGQMAGVDKARLWVRMLFLCGEFIEQLITDPEATGDIRMKTLSIHPSRLITPMGMAGDKTVVMGVRLSSTGKPRQYYLSKPQSSLMSISNTDYVTLSPDMLLHRFIVSEPEQARGIPWLSSVLNVISDMRSYDEHVLQAAKHAASWAVYMFTRDAGVEQVNIEEGSTAEIEKGMINALPPGYEVAGLNPQQPATNYIDYRKARIMDMGRPVNMPLMMILLDSSNHNYSSARFDGQLYQRGIQKLQKWMERSTLNLLVDEMTREAKFQKLPQRPQDVKYVWTWPTPPHVDPLKEANAAVSRLKSVTSTLTMELAARGIDIETFVQMLKREIDIFKAEGLQHPFEVWLNEWAQSAGEVLDNGDTGGDAKDDDTKDDDTKDDDTGGNANSKNNRAAVGVDHDA